MAAPNRVVWARFQKKEENIETAILQKQARSNFTIFLKNLTLNYLPKIFVEQILRRPLNLKTYPKRTFWWVLIVSSFSDVQHFIHSFIVWGGGGEAVGRKESEKIQNHADVNIWMVP